MGDREFKALKLTAGGKAELVELSLEQSNRIPIYIKALEVAAKSRVPDPKFSNYFVRESIGSRTMHEAGNIEYGFCQALHGEESAVAVLRASQERERDANESLVLGIVAGNPGNVAAPCGNCRDIMRDVFGPELEIVSGSPEGGITVVAKLSDYLFDGYAPEALRKDWLDLFQPDILDIPYLGNRYAYDGYSPADVHPERRYYVHITGRSGIYIGALDLMCDYHPIYPLRDAIRQARRAGDLHFGAVFIVGQDTSNELANIPPHVMYKDRQHLMEFNLGQELLDGKECDPHVILVRLKQTSSGSEISRVWRTTVKEWLPFPFSPRNFGQEFISKFTQYLKSRR